MKTLFLEAPYEKKIQLDPGLLDYLKKNNYLRLGLFASIQFMDQLAQVKELLHEFTLITTKVPRTMHEGQLLGCNTYALNTEDVDCYLYIGDGNFHPLALVLGQKDNKGLKEVICNDPRGEMKILTIDDIKSSLKRYRGSLVKFFTCKNIGVVITIKPGQEQFRPSLALENKYPDKKFYYFIDNNISFNQLENFPFIETWVNTACPRIGFDDQEMFRRGVINLTDAMMAEKLLTQESYLNR